MFSPSRKSSNMVSRSEVIRSIPSTLSIDSVSRLRSCITFWDFSWSSQKPGSPSVASILASSYFFLDGSKIAPHSFRLLTEREVLSFEFVEGHSLHFNRSALLLFVIEE